MVWSPVGDGWNTWLLLDGLVTCWEWMEHIIVRWSGHLVHWPCLTLGVKVGDRSPRERGDEGEGGGGGEDMYLPCCTVTREKGGGGRTCICLVVL